MSVNPATVLATPAAHSLIHWLVLAGMDADCGDLPAQYAAPPVRENPEAAQPSGPAASFAKTAGATPKASSAPAPAPAIAALPVENFRTIEELTVFYKTWKESGLARTASQAVLPRGCLQTPCLMVIGDMPDDSEDRSGEAFSSPANRMVQEALRAAGINESDILYSYLSKWRTPAKRPLTNAEREICARLLAQEIALVDPQMILAMGESTIRGLMPDAPQNAVKASSPFIHKNHIVNKSFTFYTSQKGEFVVKNKGMKKTFWLRLLDMAAGIRAR